MFIAKFAFIIYDLYKTNINNEIFLKKSLFYILKIVEKFLKKLIIFIVKIDLITQIKEMYIENEIAQRIIITKIFEQKRIFYNLIKKRVRIELKNCEIYNDIFYIKSRFYVFDNLKLKTKIVKNTYKLLLNKHIKRSSIYEKINKYYY